MIAWKERMRASRKEWKFSWYLGSSPPSVRRGGMIGEKREKKGGVYGGTSSEQSAIGYQCHWPSACSSIRWWMQQLLVPKLPCKKFKAVMIYFKNWQREQITRKCTLQEGTIFYFATSCLAVPLCNWSQQRFTSLLQLLVACWINVQKIWEESVNKLATGCILRAPSCGPWFSYWWLAPVEVEGRITSLSIPDPSSSSMRASASSIMLTRFVLKDVVGRSGGQHARKVVGCGLWTLAG